MLGYGSQPPLSVSQQLCLLLGAESTHKICDTTSQQKQKAMFCVHGKDHGHATNCPCQGDLQTSTSHQLPN